MIGFQHRELWIPPQRKFLRGKETTNLTERIPPRRKLSRKKSDLAGLLQTSPPQTATTTPTFLRPDGFTAAVKRRSDRNGKTKEVSVDPLRREKVEGED